MQTCKKIRQNLILYAYNELDPAERARLEAHLQGCGPCRHQLQQLRQLHHGIPARPLIEPDESTLQVLRNAVSHKIRAQTGQRWQWRLLPFPFGQPLAAFQVGFALLLIGLGFLLGRQTAGHAPGDRTPLQMQNLLTATQEIQAANSAIHPFLAGVERLKYDTQTGIVEIYYSTINDITLRGTMENPAVRQMLRHAILEENSMVLRLNALNAVDAMAKKEQRLDPEFTGTILALLNREQNLAVRLQALQVLKVLPQTAAVKNELIKILLQDANTAMRVQAYQALTGQQYSERDLEAFLQAIQDDSSRSMR